MKSTGSESPPYKLKKRKLIAENTQFNIYFDHVTGEEGVDVPDYLVVSPKRFVADGFSGVAILPVVDGKLALLKIYRHAIKGWSWEIPRGFIEPGEDLVESVARKLFEETGLRCAHENIRPLGSLHPDAGTLSARIQLFAGTECAAEQAYRANEIGHACMELFDIDTIQQHIHNNEIQDPSTLVAIFRYLHLNETAESE
ncbi:NUDIX hydrolase [Nitrospina gracilis]|uniref:NUDIX hydrolase n=1 Tax=Nitrospina gracilis TaxID=35801 RepID=UPI001F2FC322|nr:NUDIX hydrolase [Nitrospina gracilis]MCF8719357.1 8-oxo-dGTP pyrophosphatase MutT (NUDIX family) [Nitrospina gracilis Nb-211]